MTRHTKNKIPKIVVCFPNLFSFACIFFLSFCSFSMNENVNKMVLVRWLSSLSPPSSSCCRQRAFNEETAFRRRKKNPTKRHVEEYCRAFTKRLLFIFAFHLIRNGFEPTVSLHRCHRLPAKCKIFIILRLFEN